MQLSLKKLFFPLTTLLFLLAFGLLVFYTSLPHLINHYGAIELKKQKLHWLDFSVTRLTPFTMEARLDVGNTTNPALHLPRITLHYSPTTLREKRITSCTISGGHILLTVTEKGIQLDGIPTTTKQEKTGSAPVFSLPAAVESLNLEDCQITINRPEQQPLHLIVNGATTFQYENKTRGYFVKGCTSHLTTTGSISTRFTTTLQTSSEGPMINCTATVNNLGDVATFFPKNFQIEGTAQLNSELVLDTRWQNIHSLHATLRSEKLLLGFENSQIVASPEQPLLATAQGNLSTLDFSLSPLSILTAGKNTISCNGQFNLTQKTLTATGNLTSEHLHDPVSFQINGEFTPQRRQLTLISQGTQQVFQGKNTISTGPYRIKSSVTDTSNGPRIATSLDCKEIHLLDYDVHLKNIRSDFSSHIPRTKKVLAVKGRIDIGKIISHNEDLAESTLHISYDHTKKDLQIEGGLTTHLATPVHLALQAVKKGDTDLIITSSLEQSQINPQFLPSFLPLPKNINFTGNISAKGEFRIGASQPEGNLEISLNDGSISIDENNLHITGISSQLSFPHLPQIASASSQKLHAANIDIGTLRFRNARITYRLEENAALFLEKGQLNWCNGTVEMAATRIAPGSTDYATTLYCDRLEFAEILNQFGVNDTSGNGSLNGKLPVRLSKRGFFFDDGFLFSTPGNSGTIRFQDTEALKQNLPDTGQAATLNYSVQALENFSYNWAKLQVHSKGDTLRISMQIDGKPAIPLPYGYQGGSLVETTQGNGLQHPLRVNVNFHLPLTKIFAFGQNFQKILENMR